MNKKNAIDLSKLPIINKINELKLLVDNHQPIDKEIQDRVFQKLKLDWNYNSNAIEGNQLNYGETVAFLMHGITAKGKTLKDHLDIKGHNEAITFLLSIVKEKREISESDIRALHKLILVEEYEVDAITIDGKPTKKRIKIGTYKTTPNSVKTRTGEMHYYAKLEETPMLMTELMAWYNDCKQDATIHPIVLASLFHYHFVAIHPFDDGNGRLARILMNLILMQQNYLPIVVKNKDKDEYYGVLAQADTQQYIPLIEYMSELLQHTLNIQLKAIKGESIEEESDIDKEIALLKKSLEKNVLERKDRNNDDIKRIFINSILPISKILNKLIDKLKELFFETNFILIYNSKNNIDDIIGNNFNGFQLVNTGIINKICLEIDLINLKSNLAKSLHRSIKFDFDVHKYHIKYKSQTIYKYHYNETISQEEINTFVNAIMKDILSQIKQQTKQD